VVTNFCVPFHAVADSASFASLGTNYGHVRDALVNRAFLDSAVEDLTKITGQKPAITRAKQSIAGFKLREGNAIGAKVTLRNNRMWEFYDRLVSLAIPRIRDFRGFNKKSFDGNGNYTLGLNEQLVFPEVEYDKVRDIRGMNITICTSANHNNQGYVLLQTLGFPFREN
jgi:large subunit ribosomal protein L5